MKKEVFLAVAVGFVLGLIITFGIWTANNTLKNHTRVTSAVPVSVTPVPTGIPVNPVATLPLAFTSPDTDETLVTSASLTVSGKTVPGAVVTLLYESGESILTADADGVFSLDITLEGGYNRISATAYDRDGNTANIRTLVTYTTSKI